MIIDSNTVWVFDLDDTLYGERKYQQSGYNHLIRLINDIYEVDVSDIVASSMKSNLDVLEEICLHLKLPLGVKETLLWEYRLHLPNIELDKNVVETIGLIRANSLGVAILTDGRALSQRKKLASLKLSSIDALISEEWGESKPGEKRFLHVQNKYPDAVEFIYVGDNIIKDFITPNNLGWTTIGLKDSGSNIHPQEIDKISSNYLPNIWIEKIEELQSLYAKQ
ncbi:HAD family hydrolase [Vibrio breoganii]